METVQNRNGLIQRQELSARTDFLIEHCHSLGISNKLHSNYSSQIIPAEQTPSLALSAPNQKHSLSPSLCLSLSLSLCLT